MSYTTECILNISSHSLHLHLWAKLKRGVACFSSLLETKVFFRTFRTFGTFVLRLMYTVVREVTFPFKTEYRSWSVLVKDLKHAVSDTSKHQCHSLSFIRDGERMLHSLSQISKGTSTANFGNISFLIQGRKEQSSVFFQTSDFLTSVSATILINMLGLLTW